MSTAQLPAVVEPLMTADELRNALPAGMKRSINQELIDQINNTLADPEMYETYRDNLLSYTSVMAEGKFKVTSYVDAVKYVSHKLRGCTNQRAFELTFPAKIQAWVAKGMVPKDISSYISSYNKSKLVNLIYEQTIIPTWVLNQDLYQQALNTQVELMLGANSELVRTTAANSVLTQLKPPESKKIELNVKSTESSAVSELRQATLELVAQQRLMIQSGQMNAQEVAHSQVIEGEFEETV